MKTKKYLQTKEIVLLLIIYLGVLETKRFRPCERERDVSFLF